MSEEHIDAAVTSESIAALRAENDALRSQLAEDAPRKSGSGVRRFSGWVLAVIAIILISLAVNVGWAKTTLLDTDAFVATLSPLARNEAVAEALSVRIGEAVIEVAELEASIVEALPEELSFIAGPVATATGSLVATVAKEIIVTDAFATVWNVALRATHASILFVLTNDGAVVAQDGTIAIDLDTVAEPVLSAVSNGSLDIGSLVGEDFSLGRIVLIESEYLGLAQDGARFLDMLGWITVLLAIVGIGLAMLVAPDRRRQIAILGFGTAIAGLINLISLRLGRGLTVGAIGDEVNRSAGLSIWDVLLGSLTSSLRALVFLALLIGFAAWFFGPGPRATHLRDAAGDGVDRWRGTTQEAPIGLSLFFYTWRRPLEWGVVGIGLFVLLIAPTVSLALVALVVIVGGAVVGGIELVAGPRAIVETAPEENEAESLDAR